MNKLPAKVQETAQKDGDATSSQSKSLDHQKPSTSKHVTATSSPTPAATITHRINKVSSLINNRRPQSMLSARALMFDEPMSSQSAYDRESLKLSTSPKQLPHVNT